MINGGTYSPLSDLDYDTIGHDLHSLAAINIRTKLGKAWTSYNGFIKWQPGVYVYKFRKKKSGYWHQMHKIYIPMTPFKKLRKFKKIAKA